MQKTGQTLCYDEDGVQRDCIGTGEDGEHQNGVAWPNPRFTDKSDGTVIDNLNGLIWLKDANCIATNYPGFDNDLTEGDGRVTWQHALDFVAEINDGTYPICGAGATDWRLPNINELISLVHKGYSDPAVPNTAGTGKWSEGDLFADVRSDRYYWSSSSLSYYTAYAWSVDFFEGYVYDYNKSSVGYVWTVRGGQ